MKAVRERQSFPLVGVTIPRRRPWGSKGEVGFGEAKLVLAGMTLEALTTRAAAAA